ncbi:uncharacterized protein BCR38DRAFT_483971 [Pseudomassariella vexata]|uniref:Uncharacterized protein n=1 Tax=Pseudomassariella vexata TaxID=1141098 RepID=A0A1Y2E452_9PEZI|nr:uncharacterized protein BCR38DRAFT_483971 [Pseudomassariella vexata]ORY66338.1 hypothetical protein BCR38DRAFT_483971 [Pseudomassariella vexata]
MSRTTKQLIQIGVHKQLRPKVKNFKLTVECHGMRPQISELIRHNYPNLQDEKGTENRPSLRGFQHDVLFFNHKYPEAKHKVLVDRLDQSAAAGKQNPFEAEMVLKGSQYLGQQGCKTDYLVILKPYLCQQISGNNLFGNLHPQHCYGLLLNLLKMKKLDITELAVSPTLESKPLAKFSTSTRTPS